MKGVLTCLRKDSETSEMRLKKRDPGRFVWVGNSVDLGLSQQLALSE